ncbi:UNVERIFIED_CONTAM: hypothetical protein GTU68_024305 [Idotea baltica]|nr:hypothetical protein [Idotea baltica]
MGGHIYRCADCNTEKPIYNSCRNRHCPKCQASATAKWLEARSSELLPVPYFHVVFTTPHELNGITLQNKEILLDILFKASSRAMQEVAKRNLEGELGFFSVLHTWGQKLEFHPHVHCVVPGVILKDDGSIKKTKQGYLLTQRKLSVVFRSIFIKLLVKAFQKEKLKFYGEQTEDGFWQLVKEIKAKEWVAYAKKPFAGSAAVLKYLSRYTHKVAISNSRIIKTEGDTVSFSYKDYSDNCAKKTLSIKTVEFVRRFLLHTLPEQFVRIRYFGSLSSAKKTNFLARVRSAIGSAIDKIKVLAKSCCPECGSTSFFKSHEIKSSFTSQAHHNKSLPKVA